MTNNEFRPTHEIVFRNGEREAVFAWFQGSVAQLIRESEHGKRTFRYAWDLRTGGVFTNRDGERVRARVIKIA